MNSRSKSISLKPGVRLKGTKCPEEEVLDAACTDKQKDVYNFQVVHPVERYVGKPPNLMVTDLEAVYEPRSLSAKLYIFTATIVPKSDVQSAEDGVTEVTGYCIPTDQVAVITLNI